MSTAAANLDVTQYVRINIGYTSMVLQAHRDSVRIVFSDAKPAKGNQAFHLLGGGEPPMPFNLINQNVWALAQSTTSSLIVTEAEDTAGAKYKATDLDTLSEPQYFGHISIRGEWYIQKMDTSTNILRYVKGSTGYEAAWADRANLSYDLYNNIF